MHTTESEVPLADFFVADSALSAVFFVADSALLAVFFVADSALSAVFFAADSALPVTCSSKAPCVKRRVPTPARESCGPAARIGSF